MMKLRSLQRWLLYGIPVLLTLTTVLYFQLEAPNNPAAQHDELDVQRILNSERRVWQSNLKSLREELSQMQAKQNELLATLNAKSSQAADHVADHAHAGKPVAPIVEVTNKPDDRAAASKAAASKAAASKAAAAAADVHPNDAGNDAGKVPVIAVLVMGCNRPEALKRSITQIIKVRPSSKSFPIVVSLDCGHAGAEQAVAEFGNEISAVIRQPNLSPPDLGDIPATKRRMLEGYTKISRHYKFALSEVFEKMKYETVIIVEDDLDVAVDFFDYMSAGERLMSKDKSIWCVSAWNDNGKEAFIDATKPELLYRADFFPGLGWMLKHDTWAELSVKWPAAFWDDWMRNPAQRKNRACLRPEISRTFTFGLVGVSQGQYWKQHLQYILLNKKPVKFSEMNLDYLLKKNYDADFEKLVYGSPEKGILDIPAAGAQAVRVTYANTVDFKMKAKQLRIMDDLRAGVPRMAYMGVVSLMFNGQRVYLAPARPWSGYVDK